MAPDEVPAQLPFGGALQSGGGHGGEGRTRPQGGQLAAVHDARLRRQSQQLHRQQLHTAVALVCCLSCRYQAGVEIQTSIAAARLKLRVSETDDTRPLFPCQAHLCRQQLRVTVTLVSRPASGMAAWMGHAIMHRGNRL